MSFGQLGAVIIRENVSSGDGQLDIMIPGHRINVVFMVCRINQYVDLMNQLNETSTEFLNKVVKILHTVSNRWDGWASKNEGDKYVVTWKLPDIEGSHDNEKNEMLMEQRTETADKALITAVKLVSEMRRSQEFLTYYRRPNMMQFFGGATHPHITFGLHMGWTIEGAIGSEYKIDACYLSPHTQIGYRIESLCEEYDMQIILSENLYNLMSLKARNTLRKIDVITMRECKEPLGIYTFDLSYDNQEAGCVPDDHKIGDLIKLEQYATINIESFQNKGVDYMFTLDADIVGLQQHI